MTPIDELAASLPPGAVLAHVVTGWRLREWAKIGDEPWRSVAGLVVSPGQARLKFVAWPLCHRYRIVTPSVTWEQSYGLRGQHEVMGVDG